MTNAVPPPKTDTQIIMERITREVKRLDRQHEELLRRVRRVEQALGLEPPMPVNKKLIEPKEAE